LVRFDELTPYEVTLPSGRKQRFVYNLKSWKEREKKKTLKLFNVYFEK